MNTGCILALNAIAACVLALPLTLFYFLELESQKLDCCSKLYAILLKK